MCHSTRNVIPFRLTFEPGQPLYEQVIYAAKKAIISGQMRSGDSFPSVRDLSKEFKINPNTAHKVVAGLLAEGLLEVRVGVGTVVVEPPKATAAERSRLLKRELEQLVIQAKKLGLNLDSVLGAVSSHWERLSDYEKEDQHTGELTKP
jgi:GntR family transcriptional regulator